MENILKDIYKSVIRVDQLVIDLTQSNCDFNEEFKLFCLKTTIASNECLDYSQLFGPKTDKPFETIVDNYLNRYLYCDYKSNNEWISRTDSIDYLNYNKNCFSILYSILNEKLFEYLLNKCLLFEEIGLNCFQQMLGFSVTNNVWNYTKLIKNESIDSRNDRLFSCENEKTIKSIKKLFDNCCDYGIQTKLITTEDTNKPLNCAENSDSNNCEKVVKNRRINRRMNEIMRKSMLYSRQSSGRLSKSFVLETHCLQTNQLFEHLFTSSQRKLFTTNAKKNLWPLLNHIIVRHKSCRFDKLLDKYCPIDSGFFSRFEYELRFALDLYTTHKQIVKYVYSVIYFVFPIQLFGTKSNFNQFYNNIKLLVTSGLNTVLYLSDIKYGIKWFECKWFEELANTSSANSISDTLIRWLTQYILTVLKSKFYITETANNKSLLFYYRFDLWQKMQSKAILKLINQNYFETINANQISDLMPTDFSKLLSLSSYRFVPKSTDFRLINRLKCNVLTDSKAMKSLLQLTLTILKKLRTISSNQSINIRESLHKKIIELKSLIDLKRIEKLYFIRADIADCYPSISQSKMYEIIDQLFESIAFNNKITIKELDYIIKAHNRLFLKHIRYVDTYQTKSLTQIAIQNNIKLRNCIIVSKPYTKSYNCLQMKNLIKTYIFKAIVKTGKNTFYQMKSGIRQGGMLSSELCSIYIESLVGHYFNDFGLLSPEMRVIYADDFLFITPSLIRAKAIVRIMSNGFEEYNLRINFNKLDANFDFNEVNVRFDNDLYFFGYRFDLNVLSVCSDYSIYSDHNISNTFNCNPNSSLKYIQLTILRQVSLQTSSILLDNRVNGIRVVVRNIFERILLQSIRLSAFLRVSPKWKSKQNLNFVLKFTLNIAKRMYKLGKKWNDLNLIRFELTHNEIKLIAVSAVLSQWSFGKISNRVIERNALKQLKQTLDKSTKHTNLVSNNCLDFIPNNSLLKPFNQILLN